MFLRQAMDPVKREQEKAKEIEEIRRGKIQKGDTAPSKKKIDSNDDEEEGEGSGDFDVLTAKQQLINGLSKLSGNQVKPSEAELEGFLNDLENILKVITFKETVEYILPVLKIFVDEPESLRAEFFLKLTSVVEKLFKSPARIST